MRKEVRYTLGVGIMAVCLVWAGCKSLGPQSKTTPAQAVSDEQIRNGGWSRVTNTRSNRAAYFGMATETFGEVARMPRGRCCGVCGVIDGKLYLAGGFWQWVDDVSDCKETWAFVPRE